MSNPINFLTFFVEWEGLILVSHGSSELTCWIKRWRHHIRWHAHLWRKSVGWRTCHPGHRGHPWRWHPRRRTFGAMSSIRAHGSKWRRHSRGHRGPGWNMHGHTMGWSWWGTHRRFGTRRNERRSTRYRGHVVRTSRRTCRGINKISDIFNIFLISVKLPEIRWKQKKRKTRPTGHNKSVFISVFLQRNTGLQAKEKNKQKLDKRFAVKLLNGHLRK